MKAPPPADQHNFLADNDAYLKGASGADGGETAETHVDHLLGIRRKLVVRRRQLAADAKNNEIVYLGRAIDIHRLQELLRAIDEAILDERHSQPTS
ncbi:hypothetical protein FJ987_09860 [Mesorhizobium sp. CU2]|uniref:hypothetical protein n=1 Tax=unclassified Mesorhizobium TaxID=325217 RepID=UPI00112D378D|nr:MULTISPECIES: hypothetical protein [unclassified Mesorhizobium]TPN81138.1 hypothetical protein FJ988_19835 [Mesorhizobium sp. CU3]TPO17063.1 hypothetical protein FJ987_09860 [Mesorhizobium sp. CU2]